MKNSKERLFEMMDIVGGMKSKKLLTEAVARSQEELDDFVRDSKYKNTFYHGTASVFDEFKKSKAKDKEGMRIGLGWGMDKFYFTDNKMNAQNSADTAKRLGKGKTPNVMMVKLKIRNPIDAEEYSTKLKQYEVELGDRKRAVKKLDKEMKSKGIDSIIDDLSGGYAVYDPNQILIIPQQL